MTPFTYKSYDQAHFTDLASEYKKIGEYEMIGDDERIGEYEVTSGMHDTSYYLYESHLLFLDSNTHHLY